MIKMPKYMSSYEQFKSMTPGRYSKKRITTVDKPKSSNRISKSRPKSDNRNSIDKRAFLDIKKSKNFKEDYINRHVNKVEKFTEDHKARSYSTSRTITSRFSKLQEIDISEEAAETTPDLSMKIKIDGPKDCSFVIIDDEMPCSKPSDKFMKKRSDTLQKTDCFGKISQVKIEDLKKENVELKSEVCALKMAMVEKDAEIQKFKIKEKMLQEKVENCQNELAGRKNEDNPNETTWRNVAGAVIANVETLARICSDIAVTQGQRMGEDEKKKVREDALKWVQSDSIYLANNKRIETNDLYDCSYGKKNNIAGKPWDFHSESPEDNSKSKEPKPIKK